MVTIPWSSKREFDSLVAMSSLFMHGILLQQIHPQTCEALEVAIEGAQHRTVHEATPRASRNCPSSQGMDCVVEAGAGPLPKARTAPTSGIRNALSNSGANDAAYVPVMCSPSRNAIFPPISA